MPTNADVVWSAVLSLSRTTSEFTAADVETAIGENSPTNRTIRNRLNGMEQMGFLSSRGGYGKVPRTYEPTHALVGNNIPEDNGDTEPRSFPYPGGKTRLAQWIQAHLPSHECYVEPFAGSAAVLLGKPPSRVEILNDADNMLIRVFKTIQRHPEELEARLSEIAFSREIHERWREHLETGDWPDDDVEATARWFTLRYTQHSAKLTGPSGFKTSKKANPATAFQNAKQALPALSERLDGVILESDDWMAVAERYDGPDTVQYFDPPYAEGKGDALYNHEGAFDHERLAEWCADAESRWLVSYEQIPAVFDLDGYHVVERETEYTSGAREGSETRETTERLICNFDPESTPGFVSDGMQQNRLGAFE